MKTLLFQCRAELPQFPVKKNNKSIFKNKRTNKFFIATNPKAKYLEEMLVKILKIEKLKKRLDTIQDECIVEIKFHYPKSVYYSKKNTISNRVADISNLYQAVEDALQTSEIIENDRLIIGHDGSRRIPIEGTKYILLIAIYTEKEALQNI